MRKFKLLGSTAVGFALGAILMTATPAVAQLATIDVAAIAQQVKQLAQETGILDVLNAMNTVQNTVSQTMKDINTAIGNTTYGDTNTLLLQGFHPKCELLQSADWSATTNHRRIEHGNGQVLARYAERPDQR